MLETRLCFHMLGSLELFGTVLEVFGLSPDMIKFSIKNPGTCRIKISQKKKVGRHMFVVCVNTCLLHWHRCLYGVLLYFQDAANALKNFQEHYLVKNLIAQDSIEKAGNGNLMKTTKQLQRKYTKLKHQVMPRNLPLQVEHITLSCSSFHTMML